MLSPEPASISAVRPRLDQECIDREARRYRTKGLRQYPIDLLAGNSEQDTNVGVEMPVAERRHDEVTDLPPVDAGDLCDGEVDHRDKLSCGRRCYRQARLADPGGAPLVGSPAHCRKLIADEDTA